jgi:hypothetical protein
VVHLAKPLPTKDQKSPGSNQTTNETNIVEIPPIQVDSICFKVNPGKSSYILITDRLLWLWQAIKYLAILAESLLSFKKN